MWDRFDILKKLPDGGIVWVETAHDLEAARERIKLFATHKPGEYVVFSQETQAVIELPWIAYSREELKGTDRRGPAKTKANKGFAEKSTAKPKTQQVVAEIVADIARTFAGKR
ncbi:MAG: hypothetical protein JWO71_3998 [Candidatus Acidoferrum typicum]|nr:hypothetical protein [Candidatus Acidoferrum typicum]